MSALLEVRNVSLSFKGVKAISDLSFSVRRGEICALIGPNGAGKSSLLNILNGVYRADAGQLFFATEPLRRPHPLQAARLGIGRTFQNNALFKKMSVLDNLLTGLSRFQRSYFLEQALGLPRASARPGLLPSAPSRCWRSSSCNPGAMLPWAAWPMACRNALSWGVR